MALGQALAHWWVAGGIVMYPLLVFAIATIGIAIERGRFWWTVQREQAAIVRAALLVYRQNPGAAIGRLRARRDLPVVRMFLTALELENPTPEEFRLALESSAQGLLPDLKRYSTALETIVNLSPLLGLLGTILGLMASFAALRWDDLGGGSGGGVTTGLSEALISTATGLIVAIAALITANSFRSLYRRQIAYLAECGGQLELLHRRRFELTTLPFDEHD